MSSGSLIGKKLGDYTILEVLGQGGMAQVYKGYDETLARYAAVKVTQSGGLPTEDETEYRERFLREARSIAKLNHPRIVGVYQFGKTDDVFYMAMGFVEGRDLRQVLKEYAKRGKRMSTTQILRIIRDISEALDYAHQNGVVHRDIKPSNIMVTADGHAVLTDFGLALNAQEGTIGNTFGSVHYIAPEQAVSSAQATGQSDLYSLGVVLYEILVGRVPFDDASAMSVALKHISDPPPPPREMNPAISPEVEAIILKILDKDPRRRFNSGQEFMRALEGAFSHSEDEDTHDLDRTEPPLSPTPKGAGNPMTTRSTNRTPPEGMRTSLPRPTVPDRGIYEQDTKIGQNDAVQPAPSNRRRLMIGAVALLVVGLIAAFAVIQSQNNPPVTPTETADNATPATTNVAVIGDPTDEATEEASATPTNEPSATPTTVAPTETPLQPSATPTESVPTNAPTQTIIIVTATLEPTSLVNATPGLEAAEGEAGALLRYNGDSLVLYNRAATRINVDELEFVQGSIRYDSSEWQVADSDLQALAPRRCFQLWTTAFRSLPAGEFPADICDVREGFRQTTRAFWVGNEGTFEVRRDGDVLATCPVARNGSDDEVRCVVNVAD